jgi:hypothetical protein
MHNIKARVPQNAPLLCPGAEVQPTVLLARSSQNWRASMNLVLSFLEHVYWIFCRHEWVRDRHDDGELGLRCMKCMKRKEHDMLRLIRSQPFYTPVEPSHVSELPEPLISRPVKAESSSGKWLMLRVFAKAIRQHRSAA